MSEHSEAPSPKLGNTTVEDLEIVVVDDKGRSKSLDHGEEIVWKELPDGKGVWKSRNDKITYTKVNVRYKYNPPKELTQ